MSLYRYRWKKVFSDDSFVTGFDNDWGPGRKDIKRVAISFGDLGISLSCSSKEDFAEWKCKRSYVANSSKADSVCTGMEIMCSTLGYKTFSSTVHDKGLSVSLGDSFDFESIEADTKYIKVGITNEGIKVSQVKD